MRRIPGSTTTPRFPVARKPPPSAFRAPTTNAKTDCIPQQPNNNLNSRRLHHGFSEPIQPSGKTKTPSGRAQAASNTAHNCNNFSDKDIKGTDSPCQPFAGPISFFTFLKPVSSPRGALPGSGRRDSPWRVAIRVHADQHTQSCRSNRRMHSITRSIAAFGPMESSQEGA